MIKVKIKKKTKRLKLEGAGKSEVLDNIVDFASSQVIKTDVFKRPALINKWFDVDVMRLKKALSSKIYQVAGNMKVSLSPLEISRAVEARAKQLIKLGNGISETIEGDILKNKEKRARDELLKVKKQKQLDKIAKAQEKLRDINRT